MGDLNFWRQLYGGYILPGPDEGNNCIDPFVIQRSAIRASEGGHAKVGLALGDNLPQGEIIACLKILAGADREDDVPFPGWVGAALPELPMARGTVLAEQLLADLHRRPLSGFQGVGNQGIQLLRCEHLAPDWHRLVFAALSDDLFRRFNILCTRYSVPMTGGAVILKQRLPRGYLGRVCYIPGQKIQL